MNTIEQDPLGCSNNPTSLSPFTGAIWEAAQLGFNLPIPASLETIADPPLSIQHDQVDQNSVAPPSSVLSGSWLQLTTSNSEHPLASTWTTQFVEGQENCGQQSLSGLLQESRSVSSEFCDNQLLHHEGSSSPQVWDLDEPPFAPYSDSVLDNVEPPDFMDCEAESTAPNEPYTSEPVTAMKSAQEQYDTCFGMVRYEVLVSDKADICSSI